MVKNLLPNLKLFLRGGGDLVKLLDQLDIRKGERGLLPNP